MCYYINIEITKSFSSFLIFYTPIYSIIDIKSAYKTSHENPHMRPHTAYAVCDDHLHAYWNPHFKSLELMKHALNQFEISILCSFAGRGPNCFHTKFIIDCKFNYTSDFKINWFEVCCIQNFLRKIPCFLFIWALKSDG
jgi:hypothetical protein